MSPESRAMLEGIADHQPTPLRHAPRRALRRLLDEHATLYVAAVRFLRAKDEAQARKALRRLKEAVALCDEPDDYL